MNNLPMVKALQIQGFRPFRDTLVEFSNPNILVGANGSGKSSLMEFLKFLRDSCYMEEIPPEIVKDSIGQEIFYKPGPKELFWTMETLLQGDQSPLFYAGNLMGYLGKIKVNFEKVFSRIEPGKEIGESIPPEKKTRIYLDFEFGEGSIGNPINGGEEKWNLKKANKLMLGGIMDPRMDTLSRLRNFIQSWKFYSAFQIDRDKLGKPVLISEEPVLKEDAGNLTSVIFYLMTEYPDIFQELQRYLKEVIPGFKNIKVKARGGPGQVMVFWNEEGMNDELTIADLSDGILRFICWAVLCLHPHPPGLICIDEPELGLHPRSFPYIAELILRASERCQILVITHSSYFLRLFDLQHISIIRKIKDSRMVYRPQSNEELLTHLEEFGTDMLKIMFKDEQKNYGY